MRGRMPVLRSERTQVDIEATIWLSTRRLPVRVVETSQGGCTIQCLQTLPVGEIVQLEISACQPSAVSVRWSMGGKSGLRFVY